MFAAAKNSNKTANSILLKHRMHFRPLNKLCNSKTYICFLDFNFLDQLAYKLIFFFQNFILRLLLA